MISRREFLKAAGMGSLAGAIGCRSLGRFSLRRGAPPKLRTITYNVYACYGWTPDEEKSKKRRAAAKDKKVMLDMAARFADALRPFQPDILTFAESPAEWVVKEIADRLALRHAFFPSGGSWPGALITRLEIIESANCPIMGGQRPKDLFTRHWGRAVLQTPLGDTILHSVHLHPSDNAVREREVTEVLKTLQNDFQSKRPLIVQGDFNHTPDRPEYGRWRAAGLIDTFKIAGVGPEITMPQPTKEAPKRIDFIWANALLGGRLREVRVLRDRPFSLSPKDPGSVALSDHLPVMATFD
jgi:endonuclease/exonuclease/phosphatase family metal-dependent hydrolase